MTPYGYGITYFRGRRWIARGSQGETHPFPTLAPLLAPDRGTINVDVAFVCLAECRDEWANRQRAVYRDAQTGLSLSLGMSGDYSVRVEYWKPFAEHCLSRGWSNADMCTVLRERRDALLDTVKRGTEEYITQRNLAQGDIGASLGEITAEQQRRLNVFVFNGIGLEVTRFAIRNFASRPLEDAGN